MHARTTTSLQLLSWLALSCSACSRPDPLPPVVDSPQPACVAQVGERYGPIAACHGAHGARGIEYLRAQVAGRDVFIVSWENCPSDDVGERQCEGERETWVELDLTPQPADALASIGDVRRLDAPSQRALLRGAIWGRGCRVVAWDDAQREQLPPELRARPVGEARDADAEGAMTIDAIVDCTSHRPGGRPVHRIDALRASAGVRGVELRVVQTLEDEAAEWE
ncbi:MAG: hypothetical protein U0234_07115 [Sandaracinus sp.]